MRRTIPLLLIALLAAPGGAAAQPYRDFFFDYRSPQPPVAGDCNAIAARVGPEATWYGEFSGRRWDNSLDNYEPFAARGCFESELACRIWQNQAITYLDLGPMNYSFCRRGLQRAR